MNFWWKDSDWKLKPKGFDVSRRTFIGGTAALLAAPMIAHAGVLMPVKKQLILPSVVTKLQGSHDGETWFDLARMFGRPGSYNPIEPGNFNGYKYNRVVIDREWRPQFAVDATAAERRYGRTPNGVIGVSAFISPLRSIA